MRPPTRRPPTNSGIRPDEYPGYPEPDQLRLYRGTGRVLGLHRRRARTRSTSSTPSKIPTPPIPRGPIASRSIKETLAAAIERLPERERIVIGLYYYEGLTLKEIGEVLGVTESRVSQLHTKAVLRLRGRIKEDLDLDALARLAPPGGRSSAVPAAECRAFLW